MNGSGTGYVYRGSFVYSTAGNSEVLESACFENNPKYLFIAFTLANSVLFANFATVVKFTAVKFRRNEVL